MLIDRIRIPYCLLNLAINAHDAMPDGGTLTIEVANAAIVDASDDRGSARCPRATMCCFRFATPAEDGHRHRAKLFGSFSTKGSSGTGLGLTVMVRSRRCMATSRSRASLAGAPPSGCTARNAGPASTIVESTQGDGFPRRSESILRRGRRGRAGDRGRVTV